MTCVIIAAVVACTGASIRVPPAEAITHMIAPYVASPGVPDDWRPYEPVVVYTAPGQPIVLTPDVRPVEPWFMSTYVGYGRFNRSPRFQPRHTPRDDPRAPHVPPTPTPPAPTPRVPGVVHQPRTYRR